MGINYYGTIYVWGENKNGLLGLGYNITEVDTPTELLHNIKDLSISENHAVAINLDGEVYSWGSGKYGELCQDKIIYCPFPTKKIVIPDDEENDNNFNFFNNTINNNFNTNKNYINHNIRTGNNVKVKKYKKVFCSDLLTCFIDEDGKFSYYGVIIKIYKGSGSAITIKRLLKDENNSDPTVLFQEKIIYELETEKFAQIVIGNGFIGLLSEKGLVYSIDHSDNITLLYTKYCVYSIGVSNNQLFGLCKNNNNDNAFNATHLNNFSNNNNNSNRNNSNFNVLNNNNNNNNESLVHINKSNFMNKTEEEDISGNSDNTQNNNNLIINSCNQMNYFLCRWIAQYSNNNIISDSWNTFLYKIVNEEKDLENMFLLNSNNMDILFIMQYTDNFPRNTSGKNVNSNNNINYQSENNMLNIENINNKINTNNINHNNISTIENRAKSFFREATIIHENLNVSGFNRKGSTLEYNYNNNNQNSLRLMGNFDDSYNLKYKRVKNNFQGIRTINMEKSKFLNSILKDNIYKDETEEISEKLNLSIRKNKNSNRKKSLSLDPFHIEVLNDNNEDRGLINFNQGNKNKIIRKPTTKMGNFNIENNNDNSLKSPDVNYHKNFDGNFNSISKNIKDLNSIQKKKILDLNNNFSQYNDRDEENYNFPHEIYDKGKIINN